MYLTTIPGTRTPIHASTVEVWFQIPAHDGYEISTSGWVRNAITGHVLAVYLARSSCRLYLRCRLGRIHRLLASALAGRALEPGELVLHINGDGLDNTPGNLRIGTAAQNCKDKVASNSNGRKLRNADVREVRALASRRSTAEIAKRYGISRNHVRAIVRRTRWNNLP